MNENNSGTRGLGDGVMKVDPSDPAVAEAHTVSFALFWGGMKPILMRERLEQDLRSSPECVHKTEAMEKCNRSEQVGLGERGQGRVWGISTDVQISEEKHQSGTRPSGRTCGAAV